MWKLIRIVAFFLLQSAIGVVGGYFLGGILMDTVLRPRSMYASLMITYTSIAVVVFVAGLVGYYLFLA